MKSAKTPNLYFFVHNSLAFTLISCHCNIMSAPCLKSVTGISSCATLMRSNTRRWSPVSTSPAHIYGCCMHECYKARQWIGPRKKVVLKQPSDDPKLLALRQSPSPYWKLIDRLTQNKVVCSLGKKQTCLPPGGARKGSYSGLSLHKRRVNANAGLMFLMDEGRLSQDLSRHPFYT